MSFLCYCVCITDANSSHSLRSHRYVQVVAEQIGLLIFAFFNSFLPQNVKIFSPEY